MISDIYFRPVDFVLWQIWKEWVLPHLLKALAEQTSNINIHLVLYQEATIVNLLEVFVHASRHFLDRGYVFIPYKNS